MLSVPTPRHTQPTHIADCWELLRSPEEEVFSTELLLLLPPLVQVITEARCTVSYFYPHVETACFHI